MPIEGSGLIDLSSNLLVDTVLKELDTMKKLNILFKQPDWKKSPSLYGKSNDLWLR